MAEAFLRVTKKLEARQEKTERLHDMLLKKSAWFKPLLITW